MGNLWGVYGETMNAPAGAVWIAGIRQHRHLREVRRCGTIGPYGDFQSLCMGLRCLTYGALWGMQTFIVAAVSDLWGAQDCGARPMGICIVAVAVFSDLWGESMGL